MRLSRLERYVPLYFSGVEHYRFLGLRSFFLELASCDVISKQNEADQTDQSTHADADHDQQHARRFATETGPSAAQQAAKPAAAAAPKTAAAPPPPPPPSGGGSNATVYALGAAVLGGGAYYYSTLSGGAKAGAASKQPAQAAFTGGDQGFLSLKLAEVVDVNHNTKRFRFELPEKNQVPGLPIASAVLTKFKGEGDEKATLRPYTPINDESTFAVASAASQCFAFGPLLNAPCR